MALGQGKIPATVITGFLGAGKTTVIRNILQNANGKRIALIINEFGDVGVDGEVLKGCGEETCREEDVVELANGCICCTVADDFIPTMNTLLEREDTPDHIVIETSGLALPQPLVRAFNWPEIRARVTVDGVVTVVDSAAVSEGRFASDEHAVQEQREADEALDHESPLEELFEDQLACADMILLNKADLMEPANLDAVEADLKDEVRQGVQFVRTANGAIDPAVLLGMAASSEDDVDNRKSHHEIHHEHHHDHDDDDDHDHHHHDHDHDDFHTLTVSLGQISDKDALEAKLTEIIKTHDILRLKGFIDVEGAAARYVVQAVGPRINGYFDRPWAPDETRKSALVVIGLHGMDEGAISAAIAL
ncbi:MAG: cobalamin biosynthesis protein CobW [Pseudomonadota bacterium]